MDTIEQELFNALTRKVASLEKSANRSRRGIRIVAIVAIFAVVASAWYCFSPVVKGVWRHV